VHLPLLLVRRRRRERLPLVPLARELLHLVPQVLRGELLQHGSRGRRRARGRGGQRRGTRQELLLQLEGGALRGRGVRRGRPARARRRGALRRRRSAGPPRLLLRRRRGLEV
jgi:hypothetical protein